MIVADIRRHLVRIVAALALFAGSAPPALAQTIQYYHSDAIGSVRLITDANGNEVARYDSLPFGQPWPSAATGSNTRQFGGKERDAETAFDYFGARYYASTQGRFSTVDPVLNIEAALTDPQRWNRYAYALNNPFSHIDSDGRQPFSAWLQALLNTPAAQRVNQAIATHAANLSMAAMRLISSPTAPEVAQAAAEFTAGTDLPGGLPATGAARLLPREVAQNFVGPVHRFVTQTDLLVFRFWTPGSASTDVGQWLTTKSTIARITSPQDAIAALNLGVSGNLATAISKIQINKGTEVFVGRVRDGARWATQVWVRDTKDLRLIGQIDEYGLLR